MRLYICRLCLLTMLASGCAQRVAGQAMPLKSCGEPEGKQAWTLSSNGYIGTYLRLARNSDVRVAVRASGQGHMNIVLADMRAGFDVNGRHREYAHTFALPAGTYLLRIELTDCLPDRPHKLTIHDVSVGDASIIAENTDALALEAADSYIWNFRRGNVSVAVPPGIAPPGTPVSVKLRRHAFNFGGTIHGENDQGLLAPNPAPGSQAERFQKFVNAHFNMLVASNGGKWSYNEKTPDVPTMEFVDACLAYAKAHGFRARQHALLWDFHWQQPAWVNQLIETALNIERDPVAAEQAKRELRRRISRRIDYYVRQRAGGYVELDVLNEPHHQPRYLRIFGPEGIADIFNETADAVQQAGADTRLYVNEYNIFQWSSPPPYDVKGKPFVADPYANWYRELFESLRHAGGRVSGVGVQYYAIKGEPVADTGNPHSPARIMQVLQNLSVLGLPISLTEFGVQKHASAEQAADVLEDTMRMVFGTDQATTFVIWGFWAGAMWDQAPAAAMVDKDWNLTAVGKRYEKLMSLWNTDLVTSVGPDGMIHFTGFWGDYDLTIGSKTYPLTLVKGQTRYTLPGE